MNFKLWLENRIIGSGDLFVADKTGNVYLTNSNIRGNQLFNFLKSLSFHNDWSQQDIVNQFKDKNILQSLEEIFKDFSQGAYGKIINNKIVIMNDAFSPSSLFLKKLSQSLGNLPIVHQGKTIDFKNLTGSIQNVFHGTTEKYLPEIMKKGLIPNSNVSNWDIEVTGINSQNKRPIYLTTDFNVAKSHAINASEKNGSKPVVLKIKIPDMSKIDYDFDSFNNETDPNFDVKNQYKQMYSSVRESGLMAYDGRIPPSHILKVITLN